MRSETNGSSLRCLSLVKHYQDRQLVRGHRNGPLKDSELVLQVFAEQRLELLKLDSANPEKEVIPAAQIIR